MPVYNLQIKDHAAFFQDEESKDLNLDSLCCINVVRNLNKKLSTTNNPYATWLIIYPTVLLWKNFPQKCCMPLGYVQESLWNDSNTTKKVVGYCTSQNDFFKIIRPPLTSIITNPLIGDFGGTLKNFVHHSPSACDIC